MTNLLRTALATALLLALVIAPAWAKGGDHYATECVTVERTYQDGTSEINRYGECPLLADVLADYPTVGGTLVLWGLHCAEDEGIMFMGIPDTLVCQTIDDLPGKASQ